MLMNERVKAMRLRKRELRVMTAVARVAMDDRGRERIAAATAQRVDWDTVLTAAEAHGVAGLLHRHIALASNVPPRIATALARQAFAATTRGLAAAHQLRGIVELLQKAGITSLPLKGPLLAASVYGDVSLRGTSCDLDLLVARRDYDQAVSLLMSIGYTRRIIPGAENRDGADDLIAPNKGTTIDLHTRLVGNSGTLPMDVEGVLARCVEREVLGTRMRFMSPEDQLLYLCLHGAKHMFARLLWIMDLSELIRTTPNLQWDVVIARAGAIHARRRLALGVLLAERVLGAEIPPPVSASLLRDPMLGVLSVVAMRRLTAAAAGTIPPTLGLLVSGELLVRERSSERRAYLSANLRPNIRDGLAVPLPRGLRWLHYVTRPVRVIHIHAVRPALLRLRARLPRRTA